MTNCGRCHTCGTEVHVVLDGEEWCPKCQKYQRPSSHGWVDYGNHTPCVEIKTVEIPSCEAHRGMCRMTVRLVWKCPVCSGPRGEVRQSRSYDGSLSMLVDSWANPCGHIDKYSSVRQEAAANGLNPRMGVAVR